MHQLKTCALVFTAFTVLSGPVRADTFGSGATAFDIDFVTIGNPGNLPDTTGNPNPAGSVLYQFRMGKFEVSGEFIDKANLAGGLGITRYTPYGPNQPATTISWTEAARFVNWLNTSTGHTAAYKFNGSTFALWQPSDTGYNPANLYRNKFAKYVLPSVDEWYKAAYYDPSTADYFDFPTGSNVAPTPVLNGTFAGTAVYTHPSPLGGGQAADVMFAGGLSPYGTMGQGGNVWEWEETEFDLVNNSSGSDLFRQLGLRGGGFASDASGLSASRRDREGDFPFSDVGFRVASVPEPGTLLISSIALLGMPFRWRGNKGHRFGDRNRMDGQHCQAIEA